MENINLNIGSIAISMVKDLPGILVKSTLPKKYEDVILAYSQFSDKIVLGGSLALNLLQLTKYDLDQRKPDLDFALTERFTEEEMSSIINFFNLESRQGNPYGDEILVDSLLKNEKLLLFSKWSYSELFNAKIYEYNVDFFNEMFLTERDIIEVKYQTSDNITFPLKLVHPSIILSFKTRYAFDTRVGKQFKHWEDLEELFHRKNADNYFKVMKEIDKTATLIRRKKLKNLELPK
jgi:hypothetical protein